MPDAPRTFSYLYGVGHKNTPNTSTVTHTIPTIHTLETSRLVALASLFSVPACPLPSPV
jgi:hypothetical protein